MKTPLTLTLLVTAAAFCVTTAFADLLVYEPFDYSPGSAIAGQQNLYSPGSPTWNGVGTAGTNGVHHIISGSLTSPSGLWTSIGNAADTVNADFGEFDRLDLPHVYYTDTTLYYSLLFNLPSVAGMTMANSNPNANNSMLIAFSNIAGAQANQPRNWGGELVIRQGSVSDTYQLGIRASSTPGGTNPGHTYWSQDLNTNETYFVIARYVQGTDAASRDDDTNSLWINPDPLSFGAPEGSEPAPDGSSLGAINTGAPTVNYAASLIIGAGISDTNTAFAAPNDILMDEIRVGTNWADVTETNIPVRITSQPRDTRALIGGQATFTVSSIFANVFQWQHNGSPIANGTQPSLTLSNIKPSDAGTYNVVVGNGTPTLTSSNATLTVFPDIYPRLAPLWSLAPGARPYLTIDGGNTPSQRGIAYNALSNTVLVVSRANSITSSTNPAIYVLNADTGADLYEMNVDPFVVSGGLNNDSLSLNYIDVADDGAVIAGNVGDNNTAPFNLYYWSNSDSATEPVRVWTGDPSGQTPPQTFGDYFAVRGAGANTQVLLDSRSGDYGALLMPTAGYNITDADSWTGDGAGLYAWFNNVAGAQTGGRTLLFDDNSDSTFWEKHGSGAFNLVGFDTTTNGSIILTNFPNLPGNPPQFAFNAGSNILVAIVFASSTNVPDTLVQYDMSDPTHPLLVESYDFPVNHQANNNGCGRVIFAGDRVYALDANNGMAAWTLAPLLHINKSASDVVLSWSSEVTGYSLMSTPSLAAPITWTDLGSGTLVGNQYFMTNSVGSGPLFYRLQK